MFQQLLEQWGMSLLAEIPHLIQAALVVVLTLFVDRRLQRLVGHAVKRSRNQRELTRLLGRLTRIGVLIGALLLVLSIFNQTRLLASFIASLGIFGLLLAFALQDITKNFAAGVLLLLQRPFGLDDRIRVGVFEGTVTDVSLRATLLRTYEGHEVLIPNADVFSSTITNLTRYPRRRHTVLVTLSHDIAPSSARKVLEAAVRRVPAIEPEPAPYVASTAVGKDDQQFEARFWLRSAEHETLEIVSSVVQALQEAVQDLKRQQAALVAQQAALAAQQASAVDEV